MSTRDMKGLALAMLIGAGVVGSEGCASIIGADFDRGFGGAGGEAATAGTSTSTAAGGGETATSSSTGTGTSTSTGGEVDRMCHFSTPGSTVEIHVLVSPTKPSGGQGAKYLLTTRAQVEDTAEFKNIAPFKLYNSMDGLHGVTLLYDCVEAHQHMISDKDNGDCECLGYSGYLENTKPPDGDPRTLVYLRGRDNADSLTPLANHQDCMDYSKDATCDKSPYYGAP